MTEPAIRVLDAGPSPPRRAGTGRLMLIGAAVVGSLAGFVIGGVVVSPVADPVPATASTVSETTTTTEGPPPTVFFAPAVRPPPAQSPTGPLSTLVPGLTGSLLAADYGQGEAWVWPVDAVAPERAMLPPGTIRVGWDATGQQAAALAFSRLGNTLYLAGDEFVPAVIGVTSFRWHASEPGRLAWIGETGDGSVGLFEATDTTGRIERRLVSTIDIELGRDGGLVAFGEFGFVLDVRHFASGFHTLALAPDGSRRATSPLFYVASRPDGTLLLAAEFQVGGSPYGLAFTDTTLAAARPADWVAAGPVAWSPDGSALATTQAANFGAALLLITDGGQFRYPTGVADARVLAWSPNGQFVVLHSPDAGDDSGPGLVFVDVLDRSLHVVPVAGDAAARIR